MHELKSHPYGTGSAMLNLTYDNEHLPGGWPSNLPPSLSLADYQNFMKKLRKITGSGLRFFGCGEYGDKNGRPHYHIIIFNYRPPDTKLFQRKETYNYYTSELITQTWDKGNVIIGDVSFDSCAYVARYCLKKITGPKADDHYGLRTKEFVTMSRRPGLAFNYYQKYKSEILAHDAIIMNGHEVKPPRYYDKLTENSDANMRHKLQHSIIENIKIKRRAKAFTSAAKADNTSRRRRTKELVRAAKLKQKARIL